MGDWRQDESVARLAAAVDAQKARVDANEKTLRTLALEVKDFGPLPEVFSWPRKPKAEPRAIRPPLELRTPFDGIALRMIVFFARQPDESLTREDIRAKFGKVAQDSSHDTFRSALNKGWLVQTGDVWQAGPKLLQEIGQ